MTLQHRRAHPLVFFLSCSCGLFLPDTSGLVSRSRDDSDIFLCEFVATVEKCDTVDAICMSLQCCSYASPCRVLLCPFVVIIVVGFSVDSNNTNDLNKR